MAEASGIRARVSLVIPGIVVTDPPPLNLASRETRRPG
jgi:hypothetical protein